MTDPPLVSVVIRAKDEAPSIGRTLDLLAGQTIGRAAEVIVVDSGSRDGTAAIARAAGARVIAIPAESFTYGGALNTGTAEARAPVVVALSAHAFPRDDGWLARMLEPFDDPTVAAAAGTDRGPDGEPLTQRVLQDADLARRVPGFGYSNGGGAFRAELWRQRPFRSDMPFTEDREWAYYWQQRGWKVMIGPDLECDHDHSKDSARETFRRTRLQWIGHGMYLDLEPYTAREALHQWWTDQETYRNRARPRLSHRRAARIAGRWVGQRSRRRG